MIIRRSSLETRAAMRLSFSKLVTALLFVIYLGNLRLLAQSNVNISRQVASFGDTIHIEVGQTFLLERTYKISRLYIADPKVLDSYIASPKQIVLTGKTAGLTSALIWDQNGTEETLRFSIDVPIADVQQALTSGFPNESIAVRASAGRLIVSGTLCSRARADEVIKLAAVFNKDLVDSLVVNSAHAQQVELKVKFIEVDRSRLSQFGINLFGPGNSTAIGSSTTGQFASTASLSSGGATGGAATGSSLANGAVLTVSNALNYLFYSTKLGAGVTIQDLQSKQLAQVLAEPTITTISGQNANFLAGGEFPFPVVQGGAGGLTSISLQFRPYGVKLEFLPRVNVDGTIELKVTPEVSSLDYTNAVTISGYTIPAISTKRADTQVVLRSGQSFAISGLLDQQTTDSLAKTPGLASIPLLGAIFRSKGSNLSTSELIVIVTPTLVDPLSQPQSPHEPDIARPLLDEKAFDQAFHGLSAKTAIPLDSKEKP